MSANVRVSPALERRLRQVLAAAVGPAVQAEMEQAVAQLARDAERVWYDQVTRRTGKSGRWASGLRASSAGIEAAVVSEDDRKQRGKFATYFIRRPGPNAVIKHPLDRNAYREALRAWRETGSLPAGIEAGRPADGQGPPGTLRRVEPHPLRGDGRVLLQELVLKPGRRAGRLLAARLATVATRGARG